MILPNLMEKYIFSYNDTDKEEGHSDAEKGLVTSEENIQSSNDSSFDLTSMNALHKTTIDHWNTQHSKNADKLKNILNSDSEEILVHAYGKKRLPKGDATFLYKDHTIELGIITDPYLYNFVKVLLCKFSFKKKTLYRAWAMLLIRYVIYFLISCPKSEGHT